MSLNIKISLVAEKTTKVIRFTENMSVHEACKVIQEKTSIGGKDHGLFKPSPEADKSSVGQWLRPEKTLEFYDITTNDILEYKKKHDIIKIRMVDETLKTILIDTSLPAVEVVEFIAKKIGLKNPEEFSLQEEQRSGVWLKNNLSIPEQVITMEQTFLLKKKFFMSDQTVSTDDPVQLHLVYCQSRDDIVSGRHPATKDEIVQFGALQAQCQVGNFLPDVHKPGYLNLKDFLPPEYRNKEIEKKVLEEWKKLVGMNEINARYRYVQLCRSLKTYGMTVFRVKDKLPGKKKLSDALLCFTRNSIIRMEAETNKVVKEYPFKYLMRWAASPESFTLDFGAHEEDYVVVLTNEGEAISTLVAGYIDLLLKKQKESNVAIDDDDEQVADVENVARVGGMAVQGITTASIGGSQYSYAQGVVDCATGAKAIQRMIDDLFGEIKAIEGNSNLTPDQRRRQLEDHARALQSLAETLENFTKQGDRLAMNSSAQKMVQSVEQLITAARQAAASGMDPNGNLMNASKSVSDALKKLINAAQEAANKPNDPDAKEKLLQARLEAQAALQKLAAVSRGFTADDGFQNLFKELANAVHHQTEELVKAARNAEGQITDPTKKQMFSSANTSLEGQNEHLLKMATILAPTAQDEDCKTSLEKAGKALEQSANFVVATGKASGLDPGSNEALKRAQERLAEALRQLLGITELPQMSNAQESADFTEAAQNILASSATLMSAQGNPTLMTKHAAILKENVQKLGAAGKGVLRTMNPQQAERMANYLKNVVNGTKALLQTIPDATKNPNDPTSFAPVKEKALELTEATQVLLADTGKGIALSALYTSAKHAAAQTTKLCTSSKVANATMRDEGAKKELEEASRLAAEAVQKLVNVLKSSHLPANDPNRSTLMKRRGTSVVIKDDLMQGCEQFAPVAYKLVSTAKTTNPKVGDNDAKNNLVYASSEAAKAIHNMLANRKALKAVKGHLETGEALEEFKAVQAELDGAMIACDTGVLQPKRGKDESLTALAKCTQDLGKTTKNLITTTKNSPEDIGPAMKETSKSTGETVKAAIDLAANLEDKNQAKGILNAVKGVTDEIKNLMATSQAVSTNPEDPNLSKMLLESGKSVVQSLVKLTDASKGVVPKKVEEFQKKSAADIEDLAERELVGAANAIDNCVSRLQQAMEAARERMQTRGIDIDEQNMTEAILEAAQHIAQSTAILVTSAVTVQKEYNKLIKAPETRSVYKRDPQWAEGLISAAKNVAATVQHLVQIANNVAQGNTSEEALIVAAQSVSAATTQLVVASTVKADPNSKGQQKLKEAASKVKKATDSLVGAAKAAAKWEEERESLQQKNEKYTLADTKIQEMEKQMEILRLEKELEKARKAVTNMRKNEYAKNANPNFNKEDDKSAPVPTGRGTAKAFNKSQPLNEENPSSPPPQRRPLPKVNWKGPGVNQKPASQQ